MAVIINQLIECSTKTTLYRYHDNKDMIKYDVVNTYNQKEKLTAGVLSAAFSFASLVTLSRGKTSFASSSENCNYIIIAFKRTLDTSTAVTSGHGKLVYRCLVSGHLAKLRMPWSCGD